MSALIKTPQRKSVLVKHNPWGFCGKLLHFPVLQAIDIKENDVLLAKTDQACVLLMEQNTLSQNLPWNWSLFSLRNQPS